MCGIAGFNWNDLNLITKMIHSLKHRGPDGSGKFLNDNISLGNTRLAIIDLTDKGKQPLHNEDESCWITFNGMIYNYEEVRKNLEEKGHNFYSNTIAEVVIHAYEEYSYNCLNQFNGQFAFCIYDDVKQELFLARDKFGIKPLYYYYKDNCFIFASEIKTILEYDFENKINKEALREYFTYRFTFAPNTILQNIFKIKPSQYLIFDLKTNHLSFHQYYSLKIDARPPVTSNKLSITSFKLMKNAVKQRLKADVPVCTFLSGGIDSSLVTSLVSQFVKELNTFSVGFENSSEFKYARIVSEQFNTIHHEYILRNEDVLKSINKMICYIDEPIGDAAFLPILYLSEKVSKGFKVVLTGDVGDETFGGYDKYKMFLYGRLISKFIPKIKLKQEIFSRVSKFSILNDVDAYIETIRVFSDNEMNQMKISPKKIYRYWSENLRTLQKLQYYDLNTSVPEDFNMKSDKMSMAFGIEQRFPFADESVIKFALSLPLKFKIRFWNEKFLLKKSFSKFLPKEITARRKSGFNTPIDFWFKTILKNQFLDLIQNKSHNLYDKQFAIDLFERLMRSGTNFKKNFLLSQKLWTIYVFEEWYNQYMV